jgi:hypothetical protein
MFFSLLDEKVVEEKNLSGFMKLLARKNKSMPGIVTFMN